MNTIITALCAFIFVITCLFNLRVGWANVRRGKIHADRTRVYGVTGAVAAAAFAVAMIASRSVWLYPELMRIESVPGESVGAGIIAIGILFLIAVMAVAGMVAMFGQVAEGLHLAKYAKH